MTAFEFQASERVFESGEIDKGLAEVTYVLHGNSSVQDSLEIETNGLRISEGRATVSTDLAHALDWAASSEKRGFSLSPTARTEGEAGMVFIFSIPDRMRVDYGMFTTAKVDEAAKTVSGAPVKWASGRKQLAVYLSEDTRAARQRIEAEHSLGKVPRQLKLPAENIVLAIHPSPELSKIVQALQQKTKRFEQLDVGEVARQLAIQIRANPNNSIADDVNLENVAAELVRRTIESVAISRARNLDLDVKRACGYRIETEAGVQDKEVNIPKLREAVHSFYQTTHADGFALGEDWLNDYLKNESEKLAAEF